METLNLFIRSIFIDNMVFAFFFGMCSYIAVSKSVKTAVGLGAAVTFVMVMTVPLNYLLNEYVLKANALVEGIDLSFLSFIVFIAVIASFTQLVEMIVEKFSPTLYNQLLTLHAAESRRWRHHKRMAEHRLRSGLGSGLVAGYRHDGRNPRKGAVLAYSSGIEGPRHRVHHHGPYGYRIHDLLGNQVVTFNKRNRK